MNVIFLTYYKNIERCDNTHTGFGDILISTGMVFVSIAMMLTIPDTSKYIKIEIGHFQNQKEYSISTTYIQMDIR